MRKTLAKLLAAIALVSTPGCIGVAGLTLNPIDSPQSSFNAFVFQPVTPFVVAPGQAFIIIVELIPVNGFVLGGQAFFNSFFLVNPNLGLVCPTLLTFGSPALGSSAFGVPTINMPISPIGIGTCTIPIDAGLGGIISLQIQVAGNGTMSNHRAYVVTLRQLPANRTSATLPTVPSANVRVRVPRRVP